MFLSDDMTDVCEIRAHFVDGGAKRLLELIFTQIGTPMTVAAKRSIGVVT